MRPTLCSKPRCGGVDTFSHLLTCTHICPVPEGDQYLADFLARLTMRATNGNPNLSTPYGQSADAEIESGIASAGEAAADQSLPSERNG